MRNSYLAILILGSAVLWPTFVGCATWSTAPTADLPSLTLPKLAPDSVVLEVAFVRIPEEQEGFSGRFWREVDEEALPTDLRRRLAANGFRVGLVGSTLPSELQDVLDQEQQTLQTDGVAAVHVGSELSVAATGCAAARATLGRSWFAATPSPKWLHLRSTMKAT